MIKGIIFDLDGTLIDTIGGIAAACNDVLRQHQFPEHKVETYMDFVGHGLAVTIYHALPESLQRQIKGDEVEVDHHHIELITFIDELNAYYLEKPLRDTRLYKGIYDVIALLKEHEIPWGIHTNKNQDIAIKVADAFFEPSQYVGLIGPTEKVPKKPDPTGSYTLIEMMKSKVGELESDEILFVGDTEVDIDTAKELGSPVVAVTWGFRTESKLKGFNPDYMVRSPKELVQVIDSLLSK